MNLFQDETANLLLDLGFEEGWVNHLSPYLSTNVLVGILNKLKQERAIKTIYPDEQDVFRIFKVCPFKSVKVVVIGQDPYFNGNADGIAFSCKNQVSPSLFQILQAIFLDTLPEGSFKDSNYMNLEYLTKQGVFLYNPNLSVVKDQPMSHEHIGWKTFTQAVFKTLIVNKGRLVWMSWGKVAQSNLPKDVPSFHQILTASHPVSASYSNSIWKCDHFTKANEYLKSKNMEEIKWL